MQAATTTDPLEPSFHPERPRLHKVSWTEGKTFTAADDPDRANEPWEPPSFVLDKDPAAQRSRTSVEELSVPRGCSRRGEGHSFARVVRSVLEPEECAELIACVNRKGFTPALLNIGRGRQRLSSHVRDGHRVIVDSEPLAAYLMDVLREYLPETIIGRRGEFCRVEDLNERCRFLCYTPGQVFEPHCDGMYVRPSGHPKANDSSVITVQLYLHDVPQQNGGGTTFLGTRQSLAFQPECGSVLMFTQDLYHEGSRVSHGLKYTMRTEVMYTQRERACATPESHDCILSDDDGDVIFEEDGGLENDTCLC